MGVGVGPAGSSSSVGLRGVQTMSSASTWGGGSSLGGFGGGPGGVSQPPQPPHECIVRVKARPYTPADDFKPRRPSGPSPAGLDGGGGGGGFGGVGAAALTGGGSLSR